MTKDKASSSGVSSTKAILGLLGVLKARGEEHLVEMAVKEVLLSSRLNALHEKSLKTAMNRGAALVARSTKTGKALAKEFTDEVGETYRELMVDDAEALVSSAIEDFYRLGMEAAWAKGTGRTKGSLRYEVSAGEVQKAGGTKSPESAHLHPSFTAVDAQAVKTLQSHQTFWIGEYYDKNLGPMIAGVAEDVIVTQGKSGAAAGKALRQHLSFGGVAAPGMSSPESLVPAGWTGSPKDYFRGVAANAATTGRVLGSVRSFEQLGVTNLTVVNPLDERTCPRCSTMNGKHVSLKEAQSQSSKLLGAKNPGEIRAAQPWLSTAAFKGMGIKPGEGPLTPEEQAAMKAAGIALPPYHFLCRCTVDVVMSEITGPSVEMPQGTPATPKPGIPLPTATAEVVAPTTPEPPTPKPPKTPKPKPLKTPKEPPAPPPAPAEPPLPPGGFPWREAELKYRPDIHLGGGHEKYTYEDPTGQLWMFKPTVSGEGFLAEAEKAASDLARKVDLKAAEIHITKVKGREGSMHRLMDYGTSTNFDKVAYETLSDADVDELLSQHTLNWLLGDNDAHAGNFLRLADQSIAGIDHGQVFKFYDSDDILDLARHPNVQFHKGTYVNRMLLYYEEGGLGARELPLDLARLKRTEAVIRKFEEMDDALFFSHAEAYMNGASKARLGIFGKGVTPEQFRAMVLARKKTLRKDFEKLFEEVEKKRRKTLGIKADKPAKAALQERAKKEADAAVTQLTDKWVEELREAHGRGRIIFMGGSGIEDMQFRAYTMKGDGVWIDGKLRPEVSGKFEDLLRKIGGFGKKPVPSSTAIVDPASSPFYQEGLASIKSYKAHLTPGHSCYDGIVPEKTEKGFKSFMDKIMKGQTYEEGTPQYEEAQHYWLTVKDYVARDEMGSVVGLKKDPELLKNLIIEPWRPPPVKAPPPPPVPDLPPGLEGVKVRRFQWGEIDKEFDGQDVVLQSRRVIPYTNPQEGYEVDFGGGVKVWYHPRFDVSGQFGEYKSFGEHDVLKVWIDSDSVGKIGREEIVGALDKLKALGVDTHLANPDELDVMFLRKAARVAGLDDSAAFKKISTTLPASEQRAALAEFWEARTPGFMKTQAWKERLLWESGVEGQGTPQWLRFDIADEIAAAKKKGAEFVHNVSATNREDYLERLESIIRSDGMLSTRERMRLGISHPDDHLRPGRRKGWSPDEDRHSGGSSYTFLRVRMNPQGQKYQVNFDFDLARSANSVGYPRDRYGTVVPDQLGIRVNQTAEGIVGMAPYSMNEFNVKGGIGLRQFLTKVYAENKTEKDAILKIFRKYGVSEIRGTPVEDIVRIVGQ